MISRQHDYLTTSEVADLLRLKERKVYDLVSSGDIPCLRVTGKLLFPRALVEAWLARHLEFSGASETLIARPPICAGSHDPLLDWALREAGSGIAVRFGGSLDGLRRLAKAEAMMAGSHLVETSADVADAADPAPEPGAPDNSIARDGWNVEHLRRMLPGQPVVLIEWAWRQQGLIVAPGNPLALKDINDLKRKRVIARQPDAGSYVLLARLAEAAGFDIAQLSLAPASALTEADVAAAVADGTADAGIAIEAVAKQYRLDFVPLQRERYDLIIWRRDYFEAPVQRLLAFCRSAPFSERAKALGGYDVSGNGTVHYNGP